MNRLNLLSLTMLSILANSLFSQSLQTEEWREDLDFLVRHFPANDRSLAPTHAYIFDEEGVQLPYFQLEQKLDRFFEMADQLDEEIPKLDDHQILVRMAALVGMANNAHSRIYLLRNRTALSSLAIRTYWFEDGLYIIRGLPETRKALGCKIIGINGIPLEDIIEKVDVQYGGNDSWKKLADALPDETQLYVLTSYSTFSAAISNVVQYRRMMKANIIGEPVGDYLTNWSEGGRFYLPNSGLEIKYANGFHDMTFFPRPDLLKLLTDDEFRNRYEQKLTQPQVLVLDEEISMRFRDYLEGRDMLLDYVIKK